MRNALRCVQYYREARCERTCPPGAWATRTTKCACSKKDAIKRRLLRLLIRLLLAFIVIALVAVLFAFVAALAALAAPVVPAAPLVVT